jgi:hypothetical protein
MSVVLLGVFVFATVLEHFLMPGLSPDRHRISEYANGPSGWLMTAGFAAWAGSLLAVACATLSSPVTPRTVALVVGLLLLIAAAGAAATAAFTTGTSAGVVLRGHHLTMGNRIHDLGSGVLGVALWGAVLIGAGIGDARLRLASMILLVLAALLAGVLSSGVLDLPGIRQRVLVGLACLWQLGLLSEVVRAFREQGHLRLASRS